MPASFLNRLRTGGRLAVSAAVVALTIWPAAAQTPTASVRGVIRDSEGMPLAGAIVTVRDEVSGSQQIVRTDQNGAYRLDNLESSRAHVVEATRGGVRVERKIFLRPGETLVLDLATTAPPSPWRLPQSGTAYALLIVTLLTLLITQSGTALFKKIGAAAGWVGQKLYQFLAPRFPERIGVPGYRTRFLRSHLAHIEIPIGPQLEVPIERAFVPLRLMGTDRDDRVDAFPFVAGHDRLMVLGGPGSGKSTLMKSLVVSILRHRSDPGLNERIPVFVVLRDLAKANHSVEDAIAAALGSLGFKNAGGFVSAALDSGRLLIVLDGLDEVGMNRASVATRIREFCQTDDVRPARNHVIVTCREASYTTRDLGDVLKATTRIEPFTPQHMRQFLQSWPTYRGKAPLALYADIQSDPQVRDTCRNPLLLTLLTGLYLEKDRFDLPSSRDQFYEVALKELFDERPARRSQEQRFSTRDKSRVLQRAALDRLETLDEKEDPELLNRRRLVEIAKAILDPETKPDFDAFIDELVRVNGVLKLLTEDSLVFGHRTFQEYLAAREAMQTRDVDAVVAYFSRTPERAEVLYFYCGLVRNVLQIRSILSKLGAEAEPAISGRALLSVTETPPSELVEPITAKLLAAIETNDEYQRELEILTSLAQRKSPEYQSARHHLSLIVDQIINLATGTGSAIVSALSSDPELAMSLVPALLAHPAVTSRVAGVQLLYDIGSADALDELVRLLQNKDKDVRGAAAVAVCNLLKSRHEELKRSAELLPARADLARWPFEAAMPGRLVLPILDILRPVPDIMLGGIESSLMLEAAYQDRPDTRDKRARALWRRAATDRRRSDLFRSTMSRSLACAQAIVLGCALALLSLQLWSYYRQDIVLIQAASPWITVTDGAAIARLNATAKTATEAARAQYPPNRTGLWRLIPASAQQPSIPEDASGAWDYLVRRTQGASNPRVIRTDGMPDFAPLRLPSPLNAQLPASVSEAMLAIPEATSRIQIWLYPSRGFLEAHYFVGLFAYGWFMLRPFRRSSAQHIFGEAAPALAWLVKHHRVVSAVAILAMMITPETPYNNIDGGAIGMSWFALPMLAVILVLYLLTVVRIPRNPYMRLIDDWLPPMQADTDTGALRVQPA